MRDIYVKVTGHGFTMEATIGPFGREPTERQVINAREAADQMFNDVTGRPVVTGVAHVQPSANG